MLAIFGSIKQRWEKCIFTRVGMAKAAYGTCSNESHHYQNNFQWNLPLALWRPKSLTINLHIFKLLHGAWSNHNQSLLTFQAARNVCTAKPFGIFLPYSVFPSPCKRQCFVKLIKQKDIKYFHLRKYVLQHLTQNPIVGSQIIHLRWFEHMVDGVIYEATSWLWSDTEFFH